MHGDYPPFEIKGGLYILREWRGHHKPFVVISGTYAINLILIKWLFLRWMIPAMMISLAQHTDLEDMVYSIAGPKI